MSSTERAGRLVHGRYPVNAHSRGLPEHGVAPVTAGARQPAVDRWILQCGDRRVDFFLVLDGFVEVYLSRGNAQHVMYVHGRQQFTGELNIFNARAVLVGGRMRAQAGSAARGRAGGTAARSVRVYGCSGEAKRSAAGRYSTASPARMTSTSWLIRCTIARSWAMKR